MDGLSHPLTTASASVKSTRAVDKAWKSPRAIQATTILTQGDSGCVAPVNSVRTWRDLVTVRCPLSPRLQTDEVEDEY